MIDKLKTYLLLICFSLIILSGSSPALAENNENVTLQLKWFHQFQFAGYYAALEKGFYKKAGLNVKIVEGSPKTDVAENVLSGKADYGVLGSELIVKRAEGKKVVILAVIMQHSLRALIVRTDSGINSPSDLAGKKIMLNRNEQAEFLAMFRFEGVSPDSITILDKDNSANNKLIAGEIDGLNGSVANQPFLFSKKGLSFNMIKPISYGVDFYGDTFFTSEKEIQKNPERVEKMIEATSDGWEYALTYPDEIIEIILKKYNRNKSREHLAFEASAIKKLILPDLVDIGHVNPHRIDRIYNIYKELEIINNDMGIKGLLYNPDKKNELFIKILVILGILTFCVIVVSCVLFLFNRELRIKVIKKTEEIQNVNIELTRNINLLYSFIDGSYDPIYAIDNNNNIFLSNKAFSDLFGHLPSEIYGKTYSFFMDEKTAGDMTRNDNRVRNRKKPVVCEIIIPDESMDRTYLFSKILFTEHNSEIGGILSIGHEITGIRNAEENLRRSEGQLRSITETSPDRIIQLDKDFRIVYINRSLSEISSNDVLGTDYYSMDENLGADIKEKLKSVLVEGITTGYESELIGKDGTKMILETIAAPNYNSGVIDGITVISRDITLRKKIEAESRKIESALRQYHKMEAIGTLAGGIAHDFNNILSAVLGYTEIIMHESKGDQNTGDNLNQIVNAVLRAKDLIGKILAFSKKREQQYEPVNICEIVNEALDLLRGSIPKSIEIKREINPNCGCVYGDNTQIHQVVMNLCTNAYQAIPGNKGTITVKLEDIEINDLDVKVIKLDLNPGSYIKLVITDTGTGIDKSYIDKIFDPYFTTKSMKDGSGMGLSVVHGIIKNMGGLISVYSEEGVGTKFEIIIPKIQSEGIKNISAPGESDKLRGTEHILVVDDEEMLTLTMKKILENSGYRVSTAMSAKEAVKLFNDNQKLIDIVITDMTMPDMNGAELSKELLKIKPGLPIILCSGFSEIIDSEETRKIGIKAFLSKPITSKSLTLVIRKILDNDCRN